MGCCCCCCYCCFCCCCCRCSATGYSSSGLSPWHCGPSFGPRSKLSRSLARQAGELFVVAASRLPPTHPHPHFSVPLLAPLQLTPIANESLNRRPPSGLRPGPPRPRSSSVLEMYRRGARRKTVRKICARRPEWRSRPQQGRRGGAARGGEGWPSGLSALQPTARHNHNYLSCHPCHAGCPPCPCRPAMTITYAILSGTSFSRSTFLLLFFLSVLLWV